MTHVDDEQPFSPDVLKKKMDINIPLFYLEIIGAPPYRWLWEYCLDNDETRRSEIIALSVEIRKVVAPLAIDSDDLVVLEQTLTKIESACREAGARMLGGKRLTKWGDDAQKKALGYLRESALS